MLLVTGTTGRLGSLTLAALRSRGVDAVGGSRTPGDGMRRIDFDEPTSLDLRGVSVLLLISAGAEEDDRVIARHAHAIEAARRDGVSHVVYTSVTGAGDHLALAVAHRATERLLVDSGLAWTVLRNGLYAELFGGLLTWTPQGLESAFGRGALAAVAREDLAQAAAIVAADPAAHRGASYDLVGDPITADDVAARLDVAHRTISLTEHRTRLHASEGLLPFQPAMLASIATSIRHGFMGGTSAALRDLLDRPPADTLAIAAATAASLRPAAAA